MPAIAPSPPYGAYRLPPWREALLSFAQGRPRSWFGRRFALLARRLALTRWPHPAVDATAEGFRLRAHLGDNVSERKFVFMPQFCDPVEREFLARHVTPDGVFLDIGANAGIYTLTAARAYAALGGAGFVLAVEANPVMLDRLRTNILLNDCGDRTRIVPVALSDREGDVPFNVSGSNLGESGLAPTTDARTIQVPGTTLIALLEREGVTRVDGVKIDVEGMEDVILAPFVREAPRSLYPRFIVIEHSPDRWRTDLFGLLSSAGYAVHSRQKMNSILVLEESGDRDV